MTCKAIRVEFMVMVGATRPEQERQEKQMTSRNRIERFLLRTEDIVIVHRSGSGTLLTAWKLDEAQRRIADGEDREKVITELAQYEVELLEGIDPGGRDEDR